MRCHGLRIIVFGLGPQSITLCIKHGPDHDGLYFVWVRWSGPVRKLYIAQRVHYKQRFKRVTRKHVKGVTIVHAWYHA